MAEATTDFKNGVSWTGAAASATIGPFILLGGVYAMATTDTGTANATLQFLSPDGTTYTAVGTSTTLSAAGFYAPIYLPAGTYEVTIGSGATLNAGFLLPVPVPAHNR